jgi:hypothetical protein
MNEVTKYEVNEVAPVDLFGGHSGLEGVDQDCLVVPFLKIAQSGTKQTKKEFPELYMPGLETGSFYSPSLRKIYGPSMRFVILKFYRNFTVYSDETQEADFLGTITPGDFRKNIENAPGSKRVKSYTLDVNGHRYVDNRNFVVENYDHPEDGRMLFSMASSNIKASRNLISMINSVQNPKNPEDPAPIWSSVWAMTTAFDPDPRGSYYKVGLIERKGWVALDRAARYKKIFSDLEEAVLDQSGIDDDAPVAAPKSAAESVVSNVFAKPATAKPAKAGDDGEQLF